MTVSGVNTFDLNVNDIIDLALKDLGVVSDARTATPTQYSDGRKRLNLIIKSLRGANNFIWKTNWLTYPITATSIVLGTDGFDYECIRNHTSSSDTKPITGSKYMSYWTKLNTATGAAWVTSTTYASACNISLSTNVVGIGNAFLRTGNSDTELMQITSKEYFGYGNKDSAGSPNSYYFKRELTSSSMFIYPFPDSTSNYVINMEVYEQLNDFVTSTNTGDVWQEWIQVLVTGLAKNWYRQYPNKSVGYDIYQAAFNEAYLNATGTDGQKGSIFFAPDYR